MMSLTADIKAIEAELAAAGASLDAMLAKAGVNRSTWTRWKNGSVTGARYDTIAKVMAAKDEVIDRANADRDAGQHQGAAA